MKTPHTPGTEPNTSPEPATPAPPTRKELAKKPHLNIAEAARYADVAPDVIRNWLNGLRINMPTARRVVALRGEKVGGRWRIKPADIDNFIKVCTEASISPNALPPAGSGETDAERRRRGVEAKARAMRKLGGY